MEKFKCLIVEDEPIAAEVLQDYILQTPFLQLKHICSDALEAMDLMRRSKTDVLFLDIQLPRMRGLDFLRTLRSAPQVILTTAYRDYAIESYELGVVDYLVKPFSFERFLGAVNKLKPASPSQVQPGTFSNEADRPHLFVNVNKKMVKVYLDQILYIESKKEYVCIVTRSKSLLTKYQLNEIVTMLPEDSFIRIHRSFVVSKSKIEAYTATDIEVAGHLLPIGRSFKELVSIFLSRSL